LNSLASLVILPAEAICQMSDVIEKARRANNGNGYPSNEPRAQRLGF